MDTAQPTEPSLSSQGSPQGSPRTTTAGSRSRNSAILRRFVAYSIFAHVGAAAMWGLPSWLAHHAEHARAAEEQRLAEHFRAEEVKTKEHVHEQRIATTRREVQEEMRKDLGKLVDGLPEKKRDSLFRKVEDKTEAQADRLAEALGDPGTPEQDLRNLEAELRRAMVASLDVELSPDVSKDLADRFLEEVDAQVAPELAARMRAGIDQRVAGTLKTEAAALIDRQSRDGGSARDEATAQLKKAIELGTAAAVAAMTGGAGMRQAEQALAAADAAMRAAEAAASPLGSAAVDAVASAETALAGAHTALTQAGAAAKSGAADAPAAASAAAEASNAFAKLAEQARDAVGSSDRAAMAAAAVISGEADLRAGVEAAFAAELATTTLPRLEKQLHEAFAKELSDNGKADDALAGVVAREATKRLAKSVPALAKVGDGVQAGLDAAAKDRAAAAKGAAAGAAAGQKASAIGTTSAGSPGAGGAAGSDGPKPSALDQALAAELAAMGKRANAAVGTVTGDGSADQGLIARATGTSPAKDGQATGGGAGSGGKEAGALEDVRDRVAAAARSMKNGRMGAASGGTGIGGLRQGAVARGGAARNEKAYQEIAGRIAGRESVQGEHWERQGAQGDAAHAEAEAGRPVPARVVTSRGPAGGTSSLVNAEPYKPTFKSIAFTSVPAVSGAFKVDGDLEKWRSIPAVGLTPEGAPDNSPQSLRVAWSSAGVFLLFTIVDPDHRLSKTETSSFWDADVAEIWIDAYNTKENHRARHSGQQFWIWPQGSASDPSLTGGESVMLKDGSYTPTAVHADRLERWSAVTATGWTLEARIPAGSIADADLAPGRILGFNTFVTTKTATAWFWSAGKAVGTQSQPDTWGDLLLAGSDAKLTLGDASAGGDGTTRSVVVGEPLRIAVSDGDMNLDPAIRDKVMVTVKDGHGGQQIAVLEENAISSGIFEGSVSTALALDEPLPGCLGVYEGERVTVVYIDQARANGARDAEVRETIRFSSAVTAQAGAPRR